MSELIGEYSGRSVRYSGNVVSSGNLVLIDFHLNDSQIVSSACYAGFIGHVAVIGEFVFLCSTDDSIVEVLNKFTTSELCSAVKTN